MTILLCATLLVGQGSAAPPPVPSPAPATPGVLVVPFELPAPDGRSSWLGEAAALLITDDMNARGVGAVARIARERAFEQLHLPANIALSRATVISTPRKGMAPWRERLFAAMARNARTAGDYFNLPAGQVIELGTKIEI